MFRRKDGAAAAPPTVFQLRQAMFSIGDDFWVENGAGERVFRVDGKALRIRKTLVVEDATGRELYAIREKLVSVRDVMTIERGGELVATVRKALIAPLRERYNVELDGGGEWRVQGNILDHEYEIRDESGRVAEVGKKWFRVRDTYGIDVMPGRDAALVVAVAIVVDAMAHPHR